MFAEEALNFYFGLRLITKNVLYICFKEFYFPFRIDERSITRFYHHERTSNIYVFIMHCYILQLVISLL